MLGGCLLAALAATGKLTPTVFLISPSFAKYIVLVCGPTLLVLLATARMPMRVLVGAAILAAPFDFVMTFHGQQISPFMVALPRPRSWPRGRCEPSPPAGGQGVAGGGAAAGACHRRIVEHGQLHLVAGRDRPYRVARVRRGAAKPGGITFVLIMIVASVAIQGALAFYEYRSGHQLNLYSSSGVTTLGSNYYFSYGVGKRYSGATPDPIALGNVLALGLPLTICLAVLTRQWWVRVLMAAVACVSTLALVLSLSRMSWIGGAVGIVVCLVLLPRAAAFRRRSRLWRWRVIVIALGLSLGGSELRTRFTSALNPTSVQSSYSTTAEGDQLRVRLVVRTIKTAEAQPLTGTGFGNLVPALNEHGVSVPPAAHAQSWYLQLLGEAGSSEAAALLCWLVAAIRDLWTGFGRYRVLAVGMAGVFVATLIDMDDGHRTPVHPGERNRRVPVRAHRRGGRPPCADGSRPGLRSMAPLETTPTYDRAGYWSDVADRLTDRQADRELAGNAGPFHRYRRTVSLERLFSLLPVTGLSVLELGSGPGGNLRAMSARGPARLVGADISPRMVELARWNTEAEMVQLDGGPLPFADQEFDSTLTHTVLQHNPDRVLAELVSELTRVTRGTLLLIQEHRPCCAIARLAGRIGCGATTSTSRWSRRSVSACGTSTPPTYGSARRRGWRSAV